MVQLQKISKGNTNVYNDLPNSLRVTLYNTDIVSVYKHEIVLYTGGYFTSTTKNRMNQTSNQFNLGFKVYQKDLAWYVDYKGETIPFKNRTAVLIR